MKKSVIILTVVALMLCFVSCKKSNTSNEIWKDAIYTEDTEIGNGEKTITFTVTALDKSVTFTVSTDKKTVGEALSEYDLLEGEQGPYGLYVKKVNGMRADYEKDNAYWSFMIDGKASMEGVDLTELEDEGSYGFTYMTQE